MLRHFKKYNLQPMRLAADFSHKADVNLVIFPTVSKR